MSIQSMVGFPETKVTIQRPTISQDKPGFPVPSFADHLTNVSAFLQPRSGDTAVRYGRENAREFAIVYFDDPSLDITEGDIVVFETRTLRIENIRTPGEMPNGHHLGYLICECEETSGE